MGLLSRIFKKKDDCREGTPEIIKQEEKAAPVITKEMVDQVIQHLRTETAMEVFLIQLQDKELTLTDSKFGGIPYLPEGGMPPVDGKGRQLRLLAQINFGQMPKNSTFPSEGILQFWCLNDDVSGADFDNYTANDTSRVLYWPEVDGRISKEKVNAKYNPYCDGEDYFPVSTEAGVLFTKTEEGMTSGDHRFEELFMKTWERYYPEVELKCFADLPDDVIEDEYNEISGFGHKMGGYPAFTQWDPREHDSAIGNHTILLLQIDSAGTQKCDIMWGDSGICNFFITEEDLKSKNFSNAAYNWDCY